MRLLQWLLLEAGRMRLGLGLLRVLVTQTVTRRCVRRDPESENTSASIQRHVAWQRLKQN